MKQDPKLLNPPDLAIALAYDGVGTPEVVAKGQGAVANRIMAMAAEHNIPLHNDPALAGLLCEVPSGEEIPETLYLAVAKVLAFTYLCTGRFDKLPKR